MAPDVNLNRPFDPRLFLVDQELDRGIGLLLAGGAELTRAAEQARHKAGLSKPEMQILMAIRYQPGQTVSDLREALNMTVPTFARILGQLDARDLILREKEVSDARRRALFLSEAGTRLTTDIAVTLRDRLRQAYKQAGPDAVEGVRRVLEALVKT